MRFAEIVLPGGEAALPSPRTQAILRYWREAIFLVKASRPGFWMTTVWFYLLPLNGDIPLRSMPFWLGLCYVGLPLGLLIYGSNDLTDQRTDQLNPRKDNLLFGARPTPAQIVSLPLRIVVVQVPFLALFWPSLGLRALAWFAGVVGVTTFYNAFAKSRPFFDAVAQAGYLMVFLLAIWLNGAPPMAWPLWIFGALFAMHSHLFGEIMDIEPDSAAGRRTTAVVIGAPATKILINFLLLIEAFLATAIPAKPWLPVGLVAGALCFVLDAFLWRERPYPVWLARYFFIGWNFFLAGEIVLGYVLSHR